MGASNKQFELDGRKVVGAILLLTAVVGALFLYLGPRATAKSPGVLHVGVRYANERSIDFLRHGKNGPGARLELLDPEGAVVLEADDLRIGRNLVPIGDLPPGPYTAKLRAEGYRPVEIAVSFDEAILRPIPDTPTPPGTHADRNMLGVRFQPTGAE